MRRAHVEFLEAGRVKLDGGEARHLRDVLRLSIGAQIELFDDDGRAGTGKILAMEPTVIVEVETVRSATLSAQSVVIASAIPKGERADWMVEKLSELGVWQWIPLKTERSVVVPGGASKRQRWQRIAIEAAKQSRRIGVMRITELMTLTEAIDAVPEKDRFMLATELEAEPLSKLLIGRSDQEITLFVGPEGGWSAAEIAQFSSAGVTAAKLTATVLRIETAAAVAAALAVVS